MAIFKVIDEKGKGLIELYNKINYIFDWRSTRSDLLFGSAVSIFDTYEEMYAVKVAFDQTERSAYRHYVLSLEENKLSMDEFKNLSIEICIHLSNFCGNYQVVMAVHVNTENLHAHFIANTTDYMLGKRLDLNFKRFYELRKGIDSILNKYGLFLQFG